MKEIGLISYTLSPETNKCPSILDRMECSIVPSFFKKIRQAKDRNELIEILLEKGKQDLQRNIIV